MEKSLQGKVVFITGSSIGIGAATAKEFASQGSKVVITYHQSQADAQQVDKECQELGSETLLVQLNVKDNQSIQEAVDQIVAKFGRVDVLINNAGVLYDGNLNIAKLGEIEDQVQTNLEGLIKMTKVALPIVKDLIINIASTVGSKAYPGYSTYAATKWGVRGFTKSLAGEISQKVVCVNPRLTATAMGDFEGDPPEKVAAVIADVVTGKMAAQSGDDINVWEH